MFAPRNSRIRVGILGGAFNPAHAGHLHISIEAIKRLGLDNIWWLASSNHPIKNTENMTEFDERIKTAEEITKKYPFIKISCIEHSFRTSYSIDTIKRLKITFPNIDFVWLIGADNLVQIHKWYRWQEIFSIVPVAVFDRKPYIYTALSGKAASIFANYKISRARDITQHKAPAWAYVNIKPHLLSSTKLR